MVDAEALAVIVDINVDSPHHGKRTHAGFSADHRD
jgi:hypothetical protein